MRVVVIDDDGIEIFAFDPVKDADREYRARHSTERETAIMHALTEALRFVLHLQQPKG